MFRTSQMRVVREEVGIAFGLSFHVECDPYSHFAFRPIDLPSDVFFQVCSCV